jgi:hypothetical protein
MIAADGSDILHWRANRPLFMLEDENSGHCTAYAAAQQVSAVSGLPRVRLCP